MCPKETSADIFSFSSYPDYFTNFPTRLLASNLTEPTETLSGTNLDYPTAYRTLGNLSEEHI